MPGTANNYIYSIISFEPLPGFFCLIYEEKDRKRAKKGNIGKIFDYMRPIFLKQRLLRAHVIRPNMDVYDQVKRYDF